MNTAKIYKNSESANPKAFINYKKYQLLYKFRQDAYLPPFKGSTLRGVIGNSLKNIVCVFKTRETCKGCPLQGSCHYATIFEPTSTITFYNKPLFPPKPYIIEPPLSTETQFKKGDKFELSFILFGKAAKSAPFLAASAKEIERKRINPLNKDNRILEFKGIELTESRELQIKDISFKPNSNNQTVDLSLHFLTPLRIKVNNRFAKELTFELFIKGILRRLSVLALYCSGIQPSFSYPLILEKAQEVQTVQSSLKWQDIPRYSNRQHTKMALGGLVGDITFARVDKNFLPIIHIAEKIHLGKQTTFGLGLFKSRIVNG